MEGLQELARQTFNREQYFIPQHLSTSYEIILIATFPSNPVLSQMIFTQEINLCRDLSEPFDADFGGESPEATLKLVRIPRGDNGDINISKRIFLEIFTSFSIDPYIQYFLARNCYGFHSVKSVDPSTDDPTYSYFIGTVLYVLIWSFKPKNMETRAILLPRRSNGLGDGDGAFRDFDNILDLYKCHIYTPCLLSFIASIHIIQFVDEYISLELQQIRDIEAHTGHGAWKPTMPRGRLPIDEITKCSQEIGACLVDLANQTRHERIAASLLAYSNDKTIDWQRSMPDACLSKYNSSTTVLNSIALTLQNQVNSGISYIEYLQERAKSQSSVVCILRLY
jgi:hypothetical protein